MNDICVKVGRKAICDLSSFDMEITDYVFDQLPDKLWEIDIQGAIDSNYDSQITTISSVSKRKLEDLNSLLEGIIAEKESDIAWHKRYYRNE